MKLDSYLAAYPELNSKWFRTAEWNLKLLHETVWSTLYVTDTANDFMNRTHAIQEVRSIFNKWSLTLILDILLLPSVVCGGSTSSPSRANFSTLSRLAHPMLHIARCRGILSISYPQSWLTHTHTNGASSTVVPRWGAAGEGQSQLSCSHEPWASFSTCHRQAARSKGG